MTGTDDNEGVTGTKTPKGADMPSVAVVILNWNSWPDTLECLESVLRQDYPSAKVIVCDNASTDGSVDRFQQWAGGDLSVISARREMAGHTLPPIPKPVSFQALNQSAQATSGCDGLADITLIRNDANIGFAAGNNVGLQYAMSQGFQYFWILNADTVVEPDALHQLVQRVQRTPSAGLCGSLLCYYHAPDVIQEAGGCASYPLLGISRRLAADRKRDSKNSWRELEAQLGYISGASCLVSRDFLRNVGLMSEEYFLYCEEVDWATRARGKYGLALAEDSIVYHKKGLATGSKAFGKSRSSSSIYYLWRARKRFTRRYHPLGLVSLFGLGSISWVTHMVKGQRTEASALLSGLLDRPYG